MKGGKWKMEKEKYKIKIYPDLIVLSTIEKKEDLDLVIVNDNLSDCQEVNLNLLEVIIYKLKKRHLFGVKELNPLVSYNPNKMNRYQYLKTIKKALRFLGIDDFIVG